MNRKLTVTFVSVLLLTTVLGTQLIGREANIADSEDFRQIVLTGSGSEGVSTTSWPMFRHDPRHTGYSTSKAPKANQTLWTYTTGGVVSSSPAVADGMVFVGSLDGNVYALNETTGAQIWNYPTGDIAYSSPAVANGLVFIGSMARKVYALNETTGALIWSYNTPFDVWSSPAVANDMVFIGLMNSGSMDGQVIALNATTGALIWSYLNREEVWSSPAVADGVVFVGGNLLAKMGVLALNQTTGALIWFYETGGTVRSSPAVVDGMVFVGSGNGKVYALNATTGTHIWNYTTGSYVYSSPAVVDGRVYIGSNDGKLYCLNATNGFLIWNYTTGASIKYSSPAVADGMVFIGSNDNKVYALNASNGSFIWSYATGGAVYSSPAVADGMVFVGSLDGKIYCFGTHDISVINVSSSATDVYAGEIVNITVTVKNQGTPFNESFDVNAYYDSVLIGKLTVTDLAESTETTLIFKWNTTGVAGGYYTISANATELPGEIDITNNVFVDGTIKVVSPVRIVEVTSCNQTGHPKGNFELGTIAYFKITINSTALIPQDTLITINLYDNATITIGVASFQGPILPGTSTIIFGIPIPTTATARTATVYANCYTDWPSQGGFPHCPEKSATLEITGP